MASTFEFDAHELSDLGRNLIGAGPIIEREFGVAMTRSTAQVQHDAQVLVSVDTGTLRRSITTDVTPFIGQVGTNLLYGRVVEEGRRPGAPMPPSGALLGWMRRHGITAEQEFVLRRSIARKGIRARPYLHPALERNKPAILREFALAMQRVAAAVLR